MIVKKPRGKITDFLRGFLDLLNIFAHFQAEEAGLG